MSLIYCVMSCLKKETKTALIINQSVAVTIGHKYILNLLQLYKSTFDYICISTSLQIYIYVLDSFQIYVALDICGVKRAPRAAGFEPAIRHARCCYRFITDVPFAKCVQV